MSTPATATRPLSIKLALVSAAVGAGFAAPAFATPVSTAPAGFTPVTFSNSQELIYALDIDHNGTTDFTLTGANSNYFALLGSGANSTSSYAGYALAYTDPSQFLSANGIKSSQTAFLSDNGASYLYAAAPYIEVIFADQAGDMVRGYLEGTLGRDSNNSFTSFTLVDFGLVDSALGTVPEPGSLALLAAGAAGIGALRRRRRAASAV